MASLVNVLSFKWQLFSLIFRCDLNLNDPILLPIIYPINEFDIKYQHQRRRMIIKIEKKVQERERETLM